MKLIINRLTLLKSGLLTLADRRLYNYLLHNAFDQLTKKSTFTIQMSDLEGVFASHEPSIDRLKESLTRLLRLLVEIEAQQNKEKIWLVSNLLSKISIDELNRTLSYSYPDICRELLTDPATLERCLIQAHFEHKYSQQIYEILALAAFACNTELTIEITDLRSRLNIPDNALKNFSDLHRFVLLPALNEINAYASFASKFDMIRKGRKVTHLCFHLTQKKIISGIINAKEIIPPKRPRMFIEKPEHEWAYAYLLNAETKERRKYFDLANKKASENGISINIEDFDRPDKWFQWVTHEVLKIKSKN